MKQILEIQLGVAWTSAKVVFLSLNFKLLHSLLLINDGFFGASE